MRRAGLLLFLAKVLFVLVVLGGVQGFSQDPPDVAMGMNPQATYHGGDFDFVDMTTGRLNLHIPLVEDHSQRGKLNFTYSLTYSSTGSWTGIQSGNFFYIEPPKYGLGGPAFVLDGQLSAPTTSCYRDRLTHYSACASFVYENGWGIGISAPVGRDGIDRRLRHLKHIFR